MNPAPLPTRLVFPRLATVLLFLAAIALPPAQATNRLVDSSTEKSSGFTNGTLAPFTICTTYAQNYPFATTLFGQPCAQFTWHQAGYNGTRTGRGTEVCSDLAIQKEGWYGFYYYLPDPGYPMNKEAGVAQWFASNSACNSWTGMMILRNNDLWISHRSYCGTPTDTLLYAGLPRNRWISIITHVVASHLNAGSFEIFIDGVRKYSATGIKFGFDTWTADDALQAPNHIGLKLGQYDYDDGHYDANEVRTSYYTNVTQLIGNPTGALDYIRNSPSDAPPPDPSTTPNPGRLINLSIRAGARDGDSTLIVGCVIGGAGASGTKPILARGIGPALADFGVAGPLAEPVLTFFKGPSVVAKNDGWRAAPHIASAAAATGAFALTNLDSKDAAIFSPSLGAGSYTLQLTGAGNSTGVALVELYDAAPPGSFTTTTPRFVNLSARTQVGTGANLLIAGFVLGGQTSKTILVRAIGPSLAPFGVAGVLANPQLKLFDNASKLIAENDDWKGTAALTAAFSQVGAFGLASTSQDAALLVTLPPGSYTAQVSGVNNTTGVALIEVYEVPDAIK